MVDDMKSFVAAAEVLKERGAYKIYVLATHGLLSSDAPALIEDSPIDEVSRHYLLVPMWTLMDMEKLMRNFYHIQYWWRVK